MKASGQEDLAKTHRHWQNKAAQVLATRTAVSQGVAVWSLCSGCPLHSLQTQGLSLAKRLGQQNYLLPIQTQGGPRATAVNSSICTALATCYTLQLVTQNPINN